MRLSHVNIYYTIEKEFDADITVYAYHNDNLFRYSVRYNSMVECLEYKKYGLIDAILYESNSVKFKFDDELMTDDGEHLEEIFGDQNTFLSFKEMFEFTLERMKSGKSNLKKDVFQDMLDIYPEKFI